MMAKIRKVNIDFVALILLVLAGLKLTSGIERVIDIGLFDESGYLYGGVSFLQKGFFPAAWAPLYALWYFFLSLFESDRIALYYLNYKILTLLPALLIYLLMRSCKISVLFSAFVAWVFLISIANLYVWPKPAHFALVIILAFLLVARTSRSYIKAAPLMAIGALLSSYVRPEFFLSYIFFVLGYIVLIAVHFKEMKLRKEIAPILALAGISFLMMNILGIPVWDKQGNRSFEAFAQHFSINWVYWTGSGLDPWVDYESIVATNFGDVHSIYGAFYTNPGIVIKHFLYNTINYIGTFVQMPFNHFNVILPGSNKIFTWIEAGLFAILVGLYALLRRKSISARWNENIRTHSIVIFSCVLFCIPTIISSIIIYPEGHYLIIQVVLISICLIMVGSSDHRSKNLPLTTLLAVLVFMVVATPYISTNWYFSEQSLPVDRELNNLHTIEYIKSLHIQQDVNMLEADGGYYIYAGDNFHRIAHSGKDVDFETFARRNNIDMIVVSDGIRNDQRFRDDTTWKAFLQDYRAFGYEATDIPGTNRTLITRKAVLAAAGH
jgi:hypothetical protein